MNEETAAILETLLAAVTSLALTVHQMAPEDHDVHASLTAVRVQLGEAYDLLRRAQFVGARARPKTEGEMEPRP
jgi:hypothetical protein